MLKDMTYEDFLSRLRAGPRDWFLYERGQIRRKTGRMFIGAEEELECPGLQVGIFFNFSNCSFKWLVAKAADNIGGHDEKIRQDLLVACGIAE